MEHEEELDIYKSFGLEKVNITFEYKRTSHCNLKSLNLLKNLNIGEDENDRICKINSYRRSINSIKPSNSQINMLRIFSIGNDDHEREEAICRSEENNILEENNIIIKDNGSSELFKDLVRELSQDIDVNKIILDKKPDKTILDLTCSSDIIKKSEYEYKYINKVKKLFCFTQKP